MTHKSGTNSNKLTIGFVLDDGLDKPDGVQQYILTLGKWLESQEHSVHYLVGESNRTDIKNMHQISKNVAMRFNGNTMSNPVFAKSSTIKKILSKYEFDVLHIQVPYHPLMGARVINKADDTTAIIGTFHILPTGRLQSIATKLLGLWLRPSLRKFDAMLSVSVPAAKFAEKTFSVKSLVLPNAIDISKFQKPGLKIHSTENNPVHIVFLGRLVPRKGCSQLLQAVKQLNRSGTAKNAFIVDIYGDGPERESLEKFVTKYKLSSVIRFHGFISEKAKIQCLQSADIAVFPSIHGESFGIVLLEAMAAGAIVLGGDNPGYRSVIGKYPESLFVPDDTASFANKLKLFIENPAERQSLLEKQQNIIASFDSEIVGRKLLTVYTDCIRAKKDR